jgi:hypothetical protein
MLHDLPAPGTPLCDHTGAARSGAPSVRESEYGSDDEMISQPRSAAANSLESPPQFLRWVKEADHL